MACWVGLHVGVGEVGAAVRIELRAAPRVEEEHPAQRHGRLGALEAVVVGADQEVGAQVERERGDRAVAKADADAAEARVEGPTARVAERDALDAQVEAPLGLPARRRGRRSDGGRGGSAHRRGTGVTVAVPAVAVTVPRRDHDHLGRSPQRHRLIDDDGGPSLSGRPGRGLPLRPGTRQLAGGARLLLSGARLLLSDARLLLGDARLLLGSPRLGRVLRRRRCHGRRGQRGRGDLHVGAEPGAGGTVIRERGQRKAHRGGDNDQGQATAHRATPLQRSQSSNRDAIRHAGEKVGVGA